MNSKHAPSFHRRTSIIALHHPQSRAPKPKIIHSTATHEATSPPPASRHTHTCLLLGSSICHFVMPFYHTVNFRCHITTKPHSKVNSLSGNFHTVLVLSTYCFSFLRIPVPLSLIRAKHQFSNILNYKF